MAAQVTDTLEIWIGGVGTGLGWCLSAEADGEGIVSGIGEAKDRAETFAREWVAAQAAALGDGWISVEERLPEHHVEVLVTGVDRGPFQAVGMWHGAADEIFDEEPGWFIWNRPFTYRPDFVTHWRPLPPLPVAEVKE